MNPKKFFFLFIGCVLGSFLGRFAGEVLLGKPPALEYCLGKTVTAKSILVCGEHTFIIEWLSPGSESDSSEEEIAL